MRKIAQFIIMEDGPFEVEFHSVQEEMESLEITPNHDASLDMSYLPVYFRQ